MKIVKDKKRLKIPTTRCESIDEGLEIGKKLVEALKQLGWMGLAANQVGISKSVCVVSVRKNVDPMILVNPRCVQSSDERVAYYESSLSIPGKKVKTVRHKTVSIECDNWENELSFGPDSNELTNENFWQDEGLAECVCVQHEIGHLNGQLITDPEVRMSQPTAKSDKIGRNETVMLKNGEKTQMVKYKKAGKFLKDGWEII